MSQLLGYQFLWDGGTRLVLSPPAQACWATFIPWPKSAGVQLQGWQGSCLWSAKEELYQRLCISKHYFVTGVLMFL